MNLLLIHAWNETETTYRGRFSSFLAYPSLTLAAIYPLIPQDKFDRIDTVNENSQTVEYDKCRYDVVMISFDTSSSIAAYRHCEEFKKRGAYTVGGGYHPTAMHDEALEHFDTIIAGPAERAVPEFISDFLDGNPKRYYENRNVCAADYPVAAKNTLTKKHTLRISAIIADRGCNNACKYCSMRTMWKSDPRPVEDVVNELKEMKAKILVFYDPNFFAKRDYAIRLMKAVKPLKILWAADATADFGYDHELMQIAYECGCRAVVVGLESTNSDSLKNAAKRFNTADKYKEIVKNIHSHGIAVNGCFVMGFDNDTKEQLLSLPERIDELGLDLCKFSILTPYPGTKIFEEYDNAGRIISKEWSRYTQNYTVFEPVNMTPDELDSIYRQVWKKAYTWKRVLKRTFSTPWGLKPYVLIAFGANLGFKFLGIDKRYKR